jgi:Sec23/Sec24 helical domain
VKSSVHRWPRLCGLLAASDPEGWLNSQHFHCLQAPLTWIAMQCNAQVHKAVADTLFAYRRHCAQSANPGQLILPEALKLLPLYCLALTKFPAFRCGLRDCPLRLCRFTSAYAHKAP